MREYLLDILRQIFGLSKPRSGRIELTRRATTEMLNSGVYPEIIADTFKYGLEIRKEVIVKKYPQFTAGLYYNMTGLRISIELRLFSKSRKAGEKICATLKT